MKHRSTTILLVAAFFAGLALLLYPTVSNYWNTYHASRAVAAYVQNVAELEQPQYDEMRRAAAAYNSALSERRGYSLSAEQNIQYSELLDISGTGVMGYLEIPAIGLTLPIYHGTGDAALQTAVGHLEWSSLPVGGSGTHCVLSGHRGLPSAKLFTDLDQLALGDTFVIRVLDETLTYEVDQILIVEPTDLSALQIKAGQDLCTLLTCTPYGVNSHRLLVRGHRTADRPEAARVTADAIQIDPRVIAPIAALPMLLALLIALLVSGQKKRPSGGSIHEKDV